jgi:hypothetical protein
MLSRIAESLYWLGRHVERADCTARILDTYLHLLPAGSWQADHQVIRSLLDSMGLSDDDTVGAGSQADSGQLVRALVFDGERASSVAGALTAARENARGVRDAIPLDVWECLNVTWHGLRTRVANGAGPHVFLRWVGERCAIANGLVNEVMSHDEGYHFLAVGRSLERADMTIRLGTLRAVLRRVHRAAQRHRVRAAGPAVPAVGAAVADRGRVVPGRTGGRRRHPIHGPAPGPVIGQTDRGPHPDQPGLPDRHRAGRRPRAPADHPAANGVERAHRRDQLLLPPGGRCDLGKHRR